MSIGSISPFRPTGTASLSVGSTSNSVALSGDGDSVVVTNTTTGLIYVKFGADAGVAAGVADMPVLGLGSVILSVNRLIKYAAAFSPTVTGVVLFTRGDGSIF